jgi:hypothetical protein
MKDSLLPKIILAIAVFIGVGLAIWTGLATQVEAADATTPQGAYTTPF